MVVRVDPEQDTVSRTTGRLKHFHWSDRPNFGDRLGPLLLRRFAGLESVRSSFTDAEIVTVGSVLQLIPVGWPGIIAGCGKLRAGSPFLPSRGTKILALRGPLTARGIPGSYALGDPGILSDELLTELPERVHSLGLLPHWSDRELEHRPEFLRFKPLIIRVSEDPLTVIRKIGSCQKLVTSSLHGAIVADSFGIPRRVEPCKLWRMDTDFKWMDYSASVGMKFRTGVTVSPRYSSVEDLKHQLWDVFRELSK